jgi:hypothetical protein
MRVCFIRVYVLASAATFNPAFCFFLANQTSFEDEFLPTAFFIAAGLDGGTPRAIRKSARKQNIQTRKFSK